MIKSYSVNSSISVFFEISESDHMRLNIFFLDLSSDFLGFYSIALSRSASWSCWFGSRRFFVLFAESSRARESGFALAFETTWKLESTFDTKLYELSAYE